MKILTLSLTLGLGLALFGPSSVCPATKQGDLMQLRVSVFNSSPISPHALEQAEDKASRILRDGSVEVIWLNCPQDTLQEASFGRCSEVSFPAHLHLRIARSSRGLKPSTVGMSFLDAAGKGCYADLFYEPVQQLNEESNVAPSVVLGHAMAHELGHLLLGTNSHSPSGLMRAHWDREDLINASKGNLLFSREQSLKIRLTLEKPRKLETMEMSAELAGRGKSRSDTLPVAAPSRVKGSKEEKSLSRQLISDWRKQAFCTSLRRSFACDSTPDSGIRMVAVGRSQGTPAQLPFAREGSLNMLKKFAVT